MPETGYTVAWVLLAGLVLVAVGLWVRSWLDGRAT
jgi:LPXTG-motif cell wall-anchored protein